MMIFKTPFFLAAVLCLSYCDKKQTSDEAIINGDIGRGKKGELYLLDISKSDIIKDSTKIVDGRFTFKYKTDSTFVPFAARLCMWADYKGSKYLQPIGYLNPYYKNYVESIFYVDRGITSINVDFKDSRFQFYELHGSQQNEPFYRHVEFSLPSGETNEKDRELALIGDRNKIEKYPGSYYLIHQLYVNRAKFEANELAILMGEFDEDLKKSLPFSNLKRWERCGGNTDKNLSNPNLIDDKNVHQATFNPTSKLNLLIFWASWCAPCRKEIPVLKELYLKYGNKGLSMTSISIDNNESHWQNALGVEKMPWRQLIASDSSKQVFDLEYDISTIPVAVLIDQNRKIIHRFSGLLPAEEYCKFLNILDPK